MKRYIRLIALTPLIAVIAAGIAAWFLWQSGDISNPWLLTADKSAEQQTSYMNILISGVGTGCLWGYVCGVLLWLSRRKTIKAGNTSLLPEQENPHVIHIGGTQTGKTACLLQTLQTIRRRGDPVILVDPCGEFTKHFYSEGGRNDRILSPGEARSVKWALPAELKAGIKAEMLAEKIVGEGVGNEKEWCGYAQGLMRDILLALIKRGPVTNGDIMRAILLGPKEQYELLKGTPSAVHFSPGTEKFIGSVRAILANYTAPLLEFDPNSNADDFAIARWIDALRDADGQGKRRWPWLFLTTQTGDMSNAQKQLLSAHLSLAIHRTLSLPVNRKRRIWFIIEELGNIGAIVGLKQMLSMGAKHGACVAAVAQSTSQFDELYNVDGAQTLMSCFSSVVVTRLADAKTAKYFEEYFGKKEIVEWHRNTSSQAGQSSSGRSEQVRVRPRFYSHELQELNGKCVTWIVGNQIRCRRIPKMRLPEITDAFVPRHTPFRYPESLPSLETFLTANTHISFEADGPKWKE